MIKSASVIRKTSFLLIFFLFTLPGFAAENISDQAKSILENLNKMKHAYPQQKVFLHLDKHEYLAGDTIWVKGYVVNATTLKPDTLSSNLFVEIINSDGKPVSISLFRLKEGYAKGEVALPDSISEGNYQLRSYTNWMNNFNEDLFFSKDLYVYNPIEENFIRRRDVWRNRRFNRQLERAQEKMQFAFFPEGGQLVAELENRVSFKAANSLGAGIKASGQVFDGRGNQIADFETFHDGMGTFKFTPKAGEKYRAEIVFENGDNKRVELPRASDAGILLSATQNDNALQIKVEPNFNPDDRNIPDHFILLVHTRGDVNYLEEFRTGGEKHKTEVSLNSLPTGVSQIMLFDQEGQPIAERLVFVNHMDWKMASLGNAEINNGSDGQKIQVNLELKESLPGESYSVAVLDAKDDALDYRSNIATDLLMLGDIGIGTVNDPWFYLANDDESTRKAMDLLMTTHGWRRFDWKALAKGEFPELRYPFLHGITISGVVSPRSSGRITGELDVELAISQEKIDIYETSTDSHGNFVFPNLDYDGLFSAEFRIDAGHERRAMHLRLNQRSYEDVKFTKNFNTRPRRVTSRGDEWERVSQPETVIRSREPADKGREPLSMFGEPKQTIYFDDIRDQLHSVMDVLRTRVSGLRIINGEVILRGPTSFMQSNEPLFYLDGVSVQRNVFLNVNVNDIDRLEVITGPESAIFGSRGANGALLIWTLRGGHQFHITHKYFLKGYHEPSETYQTSINTDIYKISGIDRTLFWHPELKPDNAGNLAISVPYDEHIRNLRVVIQGVDEKGRITFSEYLLDDEKPIN